MSSLGEITQEKQRVSEALARIAQARRERSFPSRPLHRPRQLLQRSGKAGLYRSPDEPQADLLRRLNLERITPREVGDLIYQLRVTGNRATHDLSGTHGEALTGLKVARQLGIWFHRTFSKATGFKAGQFVPPPDPAAATEALHTELARLREELTASQTTAERARAEAEEHQRSRLSAEERARKEQEDRAVWEQLAAEADGARAVLAAELAQLQAVAISTPTAIQKVAEQATEAAKAIDLDEMATRAIIDQQLRDCGWEVDSQTLRYALGARPIKNRSMAIAEWPTASGPADYALFVDAQCVALAEAKRRRKNVSAAIDQAERYSKGFAPSHEIPVPGGPWGEFRGPFVFSANGRAYLKQIETESGIWFRDVRRPANLRRVLPAFTPMLCCRSAIQMGRFGPVRYIALTDVVFEDRWGQPYRD